ncbi:unnamed protein product [Rhodiola kirilowii]
MYPMERQLGQYKKFVRKTQYPEVGIAEQYVAQEYVMYCKWYMGEIKDSTNQEEEEYWDISVVSHVIKSMGSNRRVRLNNNDIDLIYWRVIKNCEEAREYVKRHV